MDKHRPFFINNIFIYIIYQNIDCQLYNIK